RLKVSRPDAEVVSGNMREKLNDNPLAQAVVIGVLLLVAGVFAMTSMGGSSEEEEGASATAEVVATATADAPAGGRATLPPPDSGRGRWRPAADAPRRDRRLRRQRDRRPALRSRRRHRRPHGRRRPPPPRLPAERRLVRGTRPQYLPLREHRAGDRTQPRAGA